MFGGSSKKKKPAAKGGAANTEPSVEPSVEPSAASSTPSNPPVVFKERTYQEKLAAVDDLMFKATQKSIALATMEESMIRLQKAIAVERDGRVVAEAEAEVQRSAREKAEQKIQKEIEERHDLIARLDRANDVARRAENEARDLRLAAKYRDVEVDRSAQEKILEADLALVKREFAEFRANRAEEKTIRDLERRMAEERPRLDEDSERTRTERRIKEAVQMALAKHEREASLASMKASEEKIRALEVAGVQRRQAMEVQARIHQEELRRVQESAARDAETIREEMRPARWEVEKLQRDRLEDQRKHAEDRRLALRQASLEYEANLEKIKVSHALELHTLRRANEDRLAVHERERARSETKFSALTSTVSTDLARTEAAFKRERELRRVAEDNSARDLRARDEAEAEFESLRAERREAMDLVSEARRARDTAERRTKETYLEIERAKVAGEKRIMMHSDDVLDQRPSTAEMEVSELPRSLGLVYDDDLIAAVANARAEVHDLTAPKRAADLELRRYRSRGGTDPSAVERMSAKAYMKTSALERASLELDRALGALRARRAGELKEIDDEREALKRLTSGEESDAGGKESRASGLVGNESRDEDDSRSDSEEDDGFDGDEAVVNDRARASSANARARAFASGRSGDAASAAGWKTEKNKTPGKENEEAVVEKFAPPSSPPARIRESPHKKNEPLESKPSNSNPARLPVKPFKFSPLEW